MYNINLATRNLALTDFNQNRLNSFLKDKKKSKKSDMTKPNYLSSMNPYRYASKFYYYLILARNRKKIKKINKIKVYVFFIMLNGRTNLK